MIRLNCWELSLPHSLSFFLQYNPVFDTAISADESGQLQYWTGPKQDYKMPKCVRFESAMDTDLFTFVMVCMSIPILPALPVLPVKRNEVSMSA